MLRRALAVLVLILCAPFAGAQGAVTLLDVDVTTAVTGLTGSAFPLPRLPIDAPKYLAAQGKFTYGGSGGTNATAYVQTSLDAGLTWIDIMSFQFTTATATKVSSVVSTTALAAGATPTDGSLTANTILSGLIGDRLRVKYTTTGTYAGGLASGTVIYDNGTNVSPGVLSSTTITYVDATDMTAGKLVTIDGVTYTFVAVVAAAGDVKISGTADGTMLNLQRCIMKSGGTEGAGQDYMSAGGVAHPTVTASNNGGTDTMTLAAKTFGVNAYVLTTDEATFTAVSPFAGGEASRVLTIGSTAYTFVATVASAGDVKIDVSSDATMLNLSRCINKSGGTEGPGQDYMSAGGVAHPTVTAAQNAGTDTITITAINAGVGGNTIGLVNVPAEATFTLSGATLLGGNANVSHLKVTVLPR